MKQSLAVAFAFACLVTSTSARAQAALPDSDELYHRVIEHYRPMYERYRGVAVKTEVKMQVYDSETQALRESIAVQLEEKQFFWDVPETKVKSYTKNGKVEDPDDYSTDDSEPMYPVFDAKGPTNYSVKVLTIAERQGRRCYVFEVQAKKRTERHFVGKAYVDAETLDLVFMEGTFAKRPFGVDRVSVQITARQEGPVLVFERFESQALVDVPLLFPDARVVYTGTVTEAVGIEQKQ